MSEEKSIAADVKPGGVGIVLHPSVSGSISDYLSLSSGTELASSRPRSVGPYDPEARLARGPWRPLSDEELKRYSVGGTGARGRTVWLVDLGSLGAELISELRALGFHRVWSTDEANALNRSIQAQVVVGRIATAVQPFELEPERNLSRVVAHPPGLEGVTAHHDEGIYSGLHVDSFDNAPLTGRDLSQNRLALNVGTQDRYLLFLDRTVREMSDEISPEKEELKSVTSKAVTSLGREWMKAHPDRPVVRLRVKPGQAYIAPTENIVHDASSEGQTHMDLSVVLRGKYGVRDSHQTV